MRASNRVVTIKVTHYPIQGERIPGGFVLITRLDGIRYVVRPQSVGIIHDADAGRDETLVQLPSTSASTPMRRRSPTRPRASVRFVPTVDALRDDAL